MLYPALSAEELLKSILDDLHVTPEGESLKNLVDALHRFLLETRAAGRNVVLIIDEAQDLSPEVLEQVRLISNLETDTEKLIQIVLMGQSELRDLLARHELRQLAQRVTARYHLAPLSLPEVQAYIRHRLQVADGEGKVGFDHDALVAVHRLSGGVPRLVNLICDRSLLAGYVHSTRRITAAMVREAAKEVAGDQPRGAKRWHHGLVAAGLTLLLAVLAFCAAAAARPGSRDRDAAGADRPAVRRRPRRRPRAARGSTSWCGRCRARRRSRPPPRAYRRRGAGRRSREPSCGRSSSSCARSTCRPRSSSPTPRGATPASRRCCGWTSARRSSRSAASPRSRSRSRSSTGCGPRRRSSGGPRASAAGQDAAQILSGLGFAEADLLDRGRELPAAGEPGRGRPARPAHADGTLRAIGRGAAAAVALRGAPVSLILDALRKLERERDPKQPPGVLVVGSVPWGETSRRRRVAIAAGIAAVLALAVLAGWMLRPAFKAPGVAPPSATPPVPLESRRRQLPSRARCPTSRTRPRRPSQRLLRFA